MAPRRNPFRPVLTSSPDLFAAGRPAERRALIGLAALAVSGRAPSDLGPVLTASDALALAQDAQRLQVHTMIGPVLTRHPELAAHLPDDLVLFFRAMHAANRQRLAEGLAQLAEIGAAFSAAEIPAVVLKGGGDMLSPIHADPAIRYVGDLDILVPMNRAGDALAAMRRLGAAAAAPPAHETSRFDWRGQRLSEHHLPRLVRSDWTFPVEIHVHVGPGAIASVLDADAVLGRRVPTAVPGLAVPCAEDRACHLLTHATRHSGMVSLRAWVDWSALRRRCDRAAVAARLRRAGYGQTFESCDLMADLLDAGGALRMSRNETAVVRDALRIFGGAGTRSAVDRARFLFRRCRGLILSPVYRRHIAERIVGRGFHLSGKLRRRDKE